MEARISFYIEKKNLGNNKERYIYAFVRGIVKAKTLTLNTDVRVKFQNWDQDKQVVLHTDKEHRHKNDKLESIRSKIKEEVRRFLYKHDNEKVDYQVFASFMKEAIYGESPIYVKEEPAIEKQKDFFEALEEFRRVKTTKYAKESLRKYQTIQTILKDFENQRKKKIFFEKIDQDFLEELSNYLYDNRLAKNNYVNKTIQLVKTFLKFCNEKKYLTNLDYIKYSQVSQENIEVVALTPNEIDLLRNLDLKDKPHLERIRDVYLFMILTGQRFSDYRDLLKADIKNGFWYLRQKKTKKFIEIPLTTEAREILAKYSSFDERKPFPLLTNQKVNAGIKEICKLAGIDEEIRITRQLRGETVSVVKKKYELITCHSSRRTFITNSLRLNIQPSTVMSVSGHSQLRTFQKYIDTATEDKLKLAEAWEKQSGKLNFINFKDAK